MFYMYLSYALGLIIANARQRQRLVEYRPNVLLCIFVDIIDYTLLQRFTNDSRKLVTVTNIPVLTAF